VTQSPATPDPPGLTVAPVTTWLEAAIGLRPPLEVRLIAGGRSNLTYRITDADNRRVALRRPPAGRLLATAHDMTREWAVLLALQGSEVPVAQPLALCTDVTVTGAPFYVMAWLDGIVPAGEAATATLPSAAGRRLTEDLADILAALHSVDPDAVGLGDWRRPGDYLQRQLKRWHRQLHDSGCADMELADRVHAELVRRAPAGEDRIVHGDYRAGNVMIGPDGAVMAVLDWELATLGHPLADVAWLLTSWWASPEDPAPVTQVTMRVAGAGSRDDLLARYVKRSGRDVSQLPIYEAFARWRSACITAGVRARYVAGAMGSDDYDAQEMDERGREQLQAAAALLTRL
jgi:aminoglycoside phosphotransferase (APT) family kinase protein